MGRIMNTIVIYHGNCADGFTAAWILNRALTQTNSALSNNDVEFYAGFYQNPPPNVTGKKVFILDFSYKRPIMEEIVKQAAEVIHIDHHESAINDMEGFVDPKFTSVYSYGNLKSGAMLTWNYFFPTHPVPRFVEHVDDRDRWQFKIIGTREVQANVFSYDYTFENWNMLFTMDIAQQIKEGAAIERAQAKNIKELKNVVVRRMNIGGYNVPVANIPYQFGSDMCNQLAKDEPFSAYYYDKPEFREFGLRSVDGGVNVSDVAVQYGGGGHKHASGFRITYKEAEEFEIL